MDKPTDANGVEYPTHGLFQRGDEPQRWAFTPADAVQLAAEGWTEVTPADPVQLAAEVTPADPEVPASDPTPSAGGQDSAPGKPAGKGPKEAGTGGR